jgi:hypothetical protein
MEVHHHPDLHHEKKKFKEYLLEFLMIFLAVTMGFLAENLREHFGDKEKERDYIVGLVNNLKDDTAMYHMVIRANEATRDTLKLLQRLSSGNMDDTLERRLIYRYAGYIGHYSLFRANQATMLQLKNSGGLRYIRREHAADSIATYDIQVGYIYSSEQMYLESAHAAGEAEQALLDYNYDASAGSPAGERWPLLTHDSYKLHLFFNKIAGEVGGINNYIHNMEDRLPLAVQLLQFLQKEYDLD